MRRLQLRCHIPAISSFKEQLLIVTHRNATTTSKWNGIKFALRNHYNPINALNQHANNNNSTYFSNNTTGHERVRQQRNPQTIIIIIIIAVDLLLLLSLSQDFVQRNNMQQALITDFVVPLRRSRLAITSEIIPFLRLPKPVLMNVTLPFAMLLLRILSILFKPPSQNMLTTWLAYVYPRYIAPKANVMQRSFTSDYNLLPCHQAGRYYDFPAPVRQLDGGAHPSYLILSGVVACR